MRCAVKTNGLFDRDRQTNWLTTQKHDILPPLNLLMGIMIFSSKKEWINDYFRLKRMMDLFVVFT